MKPSPCSPQTGPEMSIKNKEKNPKLKQMLKPTLPYRLTRKWFRIAYLMPGRSLALVAMLTDSGHNFSTSSSGPHTDLLCPMKDFLAGKKKEKIISACCGTDIRFVSLKYKLVLFEKSASRTVSPFRPCLRQCSRTTKNCCRGGYSESSVRPRLKED